MSSLIPSTERLAARSPDAPAAAAPALAPLAYPAPATRPVRWYNFAAYGANDILGAGSMAVISGWVLFFYTTFCGLEAWQASAIFAVARLLDAVASPVIGHVSDHFGH